MTNVNRLRSLLLLAVGGILGGLFVSAWDHRAALAERDNPQSTPAATMQADLARLKEMRRPRLIQWLMSRCSRPIYGSRPKKYGHWLTILGRNASPHAVGSALESRPEKTGTRQIADMQSIFDGVDNGTLASVEEDYPDER